MRVALKADIRITQALLMATVMRIIIAIVMTTVHTMGNTKVSQS